MGSQGQGEHGCGETLSKWFRPTRSQGVARKVFAKPLSNTSPESWHNLPRKPTTRVPTIHFSMRQSHMDGADWFFIQPSSLPLLCSYLRLAAAPTALRRAS